MVSGDRITYGHCPHSSLLPSNSLESHPQSNCRWRHNESPGNRRDPAREANTGTGAAGQQAAAEAQAGSRPRDRVVQRNESAPPPGVVEAFMREYA